MKTRTADFDAAWGDKRTRFSVFRVELKRRYFNGSNYVLESTPLTIRPREIERIGAITQRFDALQARISISNVSLVLKNIDWVWLPTNVTTGKWAPDATAALGYDPVKSQVVIYYGYTLADGTDETLEMFTGIIDDDPQFDTKSGLVTFNVMGQAEQKLKDADAQNVCTTLTNQVTSPANGNSVVSLFSGVLKSVWNIFNVRAGAAVQDQGDDQDFTLTDLNDPEVAAGIQFTAGSIPGAVAILWDGKQWHRAKTIKELAELICTESDIDSGDREIEDAVFPGVDQALLIDTEADMAASTLTNMDLASLVGKARHRLYFARASWADWSGSGPGTLFYNQFSSDPTAAMAQRHTNPLYPYNAIYITTGSGLGITDNHFLRATLTPSIGTTITKDFTSLLTSPVDDFITAGTEGPYTLDFKLIRTADSSVQYTYTYAVTIASNSRVAIRYGRQNFYGFGGGGGVGQHQVLIFDIGTYSIAPTANIKFPEIDMTTAPVDWLALASSITLNDGTATIYTKVSNSSGSSYDARVALDVDNVPASAFKRYCIIEVDTTSNAGMTDGPEIDAVTLNWRSSTLFIGSADFTGKSCLEAMQDLAELGGMEYGTKGGGVFFMRNRAVSGGADLTISQKDVVLEVQSFTSGYKEVRNVGQVRYGSAGQKGYYFAEHGATEAGEAAPTSAQRFGVRPIKLEISNLVFSQGAQVASAIAQKLYELNYLPKRRARVRCRIIPHLEVSDKVALSWHDSPLIEQQIFGDPLQTRPAMGATNTLAREILMKVVGKTDDLMKAETILDLEEIL